MEIQLGQPVVRSTTAKEMLSVTWESVKLAPDTGCLDGPALHSQRPVVRINNSSLDLIQTCKRKAYFTLERNLKSNEENTATLFGTGIHKGLEAWYLSPKASRTLGTKGCAEDGQGNHGSYHCARCESLKAFSNATLALQTLDIGDKRHTYNGYRILNSYFDKYLDDPFEILSDSQGPIVERRFEFTLIDEPAFKVIFFGTIDCIFRNTDTGITLVCDHKTTSTLGSDFYNRIKPNFQYTGYVMGAQRALGVDTDLFLVNGLQVAKTKCDLARQVTQRDQEDFKELTTAVRWAVEDYLKCRETKTWPQNAPNPCTQWGGCQYRSVCEIPVVLRENVIKSMFQGAET